MFFFNGTATTEIYTLSLHDALPISEDLGLVATEQTHVGGGSGQSVLAEPGLQVVGEVGEGERLDLGDRKSTRLNSSHANISYAVFCLKKKRNYIPNPRYHPSST